MHKIMELKEKLIGELEDYADNAKFSKEDAEAIKTMASAVDHLCNIAESGESYSMDGGSSYNRRSYARGRGRNTRRDSMGRYSSDGMHPDDGYSYDFKVDLQEIINDAPNERVKMKLQEALREM